MQKLYLDPTVPHAEKSFSTYSALDLSISADTTWAGTLHHNY